MQPWNDPTFEAKDVAEQLAHFGVPLPADAQRWHQRLLELQKSRPEAPPHGHVAELIAGGADQAAIDKLVAQQVGQSFRQQEHAEAIRLCGRRVLASVREHRDHLHAQLADIANDIITQLHNAAALDADITQLAREKRVDDAALLASAPSHAATLQDLYKVRDWYLVLPGEDWSTGIWSCRTWCNPWDVQLHVLVGVGGGMGIWEELRDGIRKGGTLWYPSIQQARDASGPHEPNNAPEPTGGPVML